jgi:glycine betaine/proline transport system substrate-binding protein
MTSSSTSRNTSPAFHGWPEALACVVLLAGAGGAVRAAAALEPSSCHRVRLAEGGWTDVAATTATLSHLLRDLGYEPQTNLLSVPVTFAAMKGRSIDVYLGNWMPAQTHTRQPYLDDGSIEVVRQNLSGAKYTLAVPAYSFAAGLRDFSDIARFGAALNYTIYGIEAGSDGNRHILTMIKENEYGLGAFHLVDSSEQGMLAQVARAYAAHAPIVFLGSEPHPMNMQFDLRYLGGDATFGPDFGGATVSTLARADYLRECPNVGRLLKNLEFTIRGESEMMKLIIADHEMPEAAASAWLAAHSATVAEWLRGVHSFAGRAVGAQLEAGPVRGLTLRFDLSSG